MIHALAGLPRSGSTLLANVLSQHPDIHVSGTSALSPCLEATVDKLSTLEEVKAELANVPNAYGRYLTAMRGLCDGWYADRPETVIFDKGRGWVIHRSLLSQLYPEAAMIVTVRDPRDVIASVEKQHRKTAAFNAPTARTIYESAELLMKPDGIVGGPMHFIEDLIRRNLPVTWVRYESFVAGPGPVLQRILAAVGAEPHTFDFENVENTATDLDALYRGKFPHDGSGAIKPSGGSWHDWIDEDLAAKIAGRYPLYMETFSYAN